MFRARVKKVNVFCSWLLATVRSMCRVRGVRSPRRTALWGFRGTRVASGKKYLESF